MSEEIHLPATADRAEIYRELLPQIEAVVLGESDPTANMANTAAILRQAFEFFWVGFYRVLTTEDGSEQLILGPFQGSLACTRIRRGRGVCGTAWAENRTQLVPDVELFPGHIACSSLSRSEIVVPLHRPDGKVAAVLDIDSDRVDDFTEIDRLSLEKLSEILSPLIFPR